jgi:hypothetical protein
MRAASEGAEDEIFDEDPRVFMKPGILVTRVAAAKVRAHDTQRYEFTKTSRRDAVVASASFVTESSSHVAILTFHSGEDRRERSPSRSVETRVCIRKFRRSSLLLR